jgi:Flp pilus assembly protein CpaB
VDQKLEEVTAGDPEVVSVVTLEVKLEQAEKLIYAAHEGRLQLAMRSPGDEITIATVSVGVADVLGDRQRRRKSGTTVQVLNGSRMDTKRF